MATIFTKIINGDIPCFKIKEDDYFIAFLDIMPLTSGHCLVVPKQEVNKIYECDANVLKQILVFAQPIAMAIEKAFPCARVGLSIIGIEVPHAHLHLVPINNADDLNFTRVKLKPTNEELEISQQKILQYLN